jgi:hypothetical protein
MKLRGADTIDVNAPATVLSAIFLGTVGVIAFIVQPGLVEGFVTILKLPPTRADDLAGVEMLGVALATVLVSLIGERVSWRYLTAAALAVGAGADLASAVLAGSPALFAARFAAGLGHGAIISLSFTFVGLTAHPARNIALYLVALLSYGAIGLWALPTVLADLGFAAAFLFFAAVTALGAVTLGHLPHASSARQTAGPGAAALPLLPIVVVLCGVLSYNIAQGIAWANLGLIGTSLGIAEQPVANDLFISQVLAVGGALVAVVLAASPRQMLLIACGIAGGAASIGALTVLHSAAAFLAAVCGFNMLWNFVLPFILSAVGDLDPRGRMISWAVALQMIGLGLGPIISAGVVGQDGFRLVELVCVGFFLASLVLLLGPLAAANRSYHPAKSRILERDAGK